MHERNTITDKDRIKGSAEQAKGKVKEVAGKVTGDAKLETEGKADKAAGKIRNAVRGLKDTLRGKLSLSEIKYERSDDAGRQGRASLRCSRRCELVASLAHPCSRKSVFGSDCSSSHNSAADGEGGALPRVLSH